VSDDKILIGEYWNKNGDNEKWIALEEYIKLQEREKKFREALESILKTEDHNSYDSKWITYNTSFLRSIARKALKQGKEE
jgi:hypothetical protein